MASLDVVGEAYLAIRQSRVVIQSYFGDSECDWVHFSVKNRRTPDGYSGIELRGVVTARVIRERDPETVECKVLVLIVDQQTFEVLVESPRVMSGCRYWCTEDDRDTLDFKIPPMTVQGFERYKKA